MSGAYRAAGVDDRAADRAVRALIGVLAGIDPGRAPLALALPGHYASVIAVDERLGIALATDSVGSKVIVAEQTGRFDTIGIDCVAMNVNDLICVGAEPLALLDYLAVERAEEDMLRQLAAGLRAGAEQAGVEIPGGEVCQLPEVIRGHPSPRGFDLVGSAIGRVTLDAVIDGSACRAGDALIGMPSSGVHSNGLTLARAALLQRAGLSLQERPAQLGGASIADALLEPTTIYVRAVLELLASPISVHGLAHITGGGVLNLPRLSPQVGFEISSPLPVPPIFDLIAACGEVSAAEMWEVFNMGCGLCAVVPCEHAEEALALLGAAHPGSARIGTLTDRAGQVALPTLGLAGDRAGGLGAV
jgi:phosphoribosylformylglycinamidine cyclo-ligase